MEWASSLPPRAASTGRQTARRQDLWGRASSTERITVVGRVDRGCGFGLIAASHQRRDEAPHRTALVTPISTPGRATTRRRPGTPRGRKGRAQPTRGSLCGDAPLDPALNHDGDMRASGLVIARGVERIRRVRRWLLRRLRLRGILAEALAYWPTAYWPTTAPPDSLESLPRHADRPDLRHNEYRRALPRRADGSRSSGAASPAPAREPPGLKQHRLARPGQLGAARARV